MLPESKIKKNIVPRSSAKKGLVRDGLIVSSSPGVVACCKLLTHAYGIKHTRERGSNRQIGAEYEIRHIERQRRRSASQQTGVEPPSRGSRKLVRGIAPL